MTNLDWRPWVALAQAEADVVFGTLREKGARRFVKAIGLAAAMVALAYAGLYAPVRKKSSRLQSQIDAARTLHQHATQYQALRDQLGSAYAQLPRWADREMFLSNAVIDSLKAENLTPENFQPVMESEAAGLVFQSSKLSMPVRFGEFYAWVLRLESARPLMHLQLVDLKKQGDTIGMNAVQAEIATIVPKRRFE